VYYKVLLNRKLNPPDLLQAPLKYKIPITRPRTNSAPAPYVPPIPSSPASSSTSSSNSSPNSSPPQSPVHTPPHSPVNIPNRQINAKRRNSSSANSAPISITGTSSRFQKMKIGMISISLFVLI
jgi:hypothetical protein